MKETKWKNNWKKVVLVKDRNIKERRKKNTREWKRTKERKTEERIAKVKDKKIF